MKTYLLILLFSAVTSAANAQFAATDSIETETAQTPEKKPGVGKRLINKLSNKYYSTKYDTNYVARPKEKWLFRLLGNQTGNYIHAKGTVCKHRRRVGMFLHYVLCLLQPQHRVRTATATSHQQSHCHHRKSVFSYLYLF
jgi:hypothetical protein